jgi:LPXTG-motif cell wall-anchored protein
MGEPEVLVSEDSSSEGSSMNMILIIVLGLIVVGGAGAYVLRKRSATN